MMRFLLFRTKIEESTPHSKENGNILFEFYAYPRIRILHHFFSQKRRCLVLQFTVKNQSKIKNLRFCSKRSAICRPKKLTLGWPIGWIWKPFVRLELGFHVATNHFALLRLPRTIPDFISGYFPCGRGGTLAPRPIWVWENDPAQPALWTTYSEPRNCDAGWGQPIRTQRS